MRVLLVIITAMALSVGLQAEDKTLPKEQQQQAEVLALRIQLAQLKGQVAALSLKLASCELGAEKAATAQATQELQKLGQEQQRFQESVTVPDGYVFEWSIPGLKKLDAK